MMTGRVENRHALLSVTFRVGSRILDIEFVVDTGFTDALCLSEEAVALLGLPFLYDLPASLADGSSVMLAVHEAIILWHNLEYTVRVLATGHRPLAGTALLEDHELTIAFQEGGLVQVTPL